MNVRCTSKGLKQFGSICRATIRSEEAPEIWAALHIVHLTHGQGRGANDADLRREYRRR